MLFKKDVLEEIAKGAVTLAFRRWQKPTVRAGGTLRTAAGVLAIDAIDMTDAGGLTDEDASRSGHLSLAALLADIADNAQVLSIASPSMLQAPTRELSCVTSAVLALANGTKYSAV